MDETEQDEPIIHKNFRDLAPMIVRKRLIIEGTTMKPIIGYEIKTYLLKLTTTMNMTIVTYPSIQHDEAYGYSGYLCWKESGSHMYTWHETEERPNFFSIDIYTCKQFHLEDVIKLTKMFVGENLLELTWRE